MQSRQGTPIKVWHIKSVQRQLYVILISLCRFFSLLLCGSQRDRKTDVDLGTKNSCTMCVKSWKSLWMGVEQHAILEANPVNSCMDSNTISLCVCVCVCTYTYNSVKVLRVTTHQDSYLSSCHWHPYHHSHQDLPCIYLGPFKFKAQGRHPRQLITEGI